MLRLALVILTLAVGFFVTPNLSLGQSGGSGTINQLSPFTVSNGTVRLASTTANFRIPSLSSLNCLGTDGNGVFQLGTCTGGGGGGGFPTYFQNGGATLNTATTTVNFTANSFAVVEDPTDTLTIRVATTTLGLLASAISDFVSTVRTSISETITGITYTSGTGVFSLDSGYVVPTTTREVEQDTAFSWGDHSLEGYITDGNTNWDNSYGFVTEGQTVGTTTAGVPGEMPYWTGIRTLGSIATGTLTETVTGLELSATRALVGGASILSLTSGYTVPTTSSTTEWGRAYSSTTALNATSPLTYTGTTGNLSIQVANGSQNGYLSSGDWTVFNNKVSTSSIDSLAEIETLVGVTNILIENDIDASSELAAIMDDETGGAGNLVFSGGPSFTGTPTFQNLYVSTTGTTTLGYASSTALTVSGNTILASATSTTLRTTTLGVGSDYLTDLTGLGLEINSGALGLLSTGAVDEYCLTYEGTGPTIEWAICGSGGGGAGGGWATTTDNNPEVTELTSYTDNDVYIGGSSSSTAEFNFDPEFPRLTMSSTTANATGSIFVTNGGLRIGSSTENMEFNFNLADTIRLISGTGISAFDFGSLKASSTNASTTKLSVYSGLSLFGGTEASTANALCQQLTGSADLCDGSDASGAGGGSSNWLFDGTRLTPSTTPVGIVVTGSSTIGDGTGAGGLTISGGATTTGELVVKDTVYSNEAWGSGTALPETLRDSGDRSIMFWYPTQGALWAGEWDTGTLEESEIGSASGVFGYNSKATGYGSFATGRANIAEGNYSVSFGNGNKSAGLQSFTFGSSNVASGTNSGTLGTNNQIGPTSASWAIGNSNTITSPDSFALGDSNTLSGDNTFAFGAVNTVSQNDAFALGRDNNVSRAASLALGSYLTIPSQNTFAVGNGISAGNPMVNNATNTLGFGLNSTIPTFVVGPGNGVGTVGNVGIGTTSPSALFSIHASAGKSTTTDFFRIASSTTAATTTHFSVDRVGTTTMLTATTSNLHVGSGIQLFGGGLMTTANDLCVQLTGSSALCDGSDASGGGGGSISTSSVPVAGNLTYWTSPSTVSDVATGTLTETVTGLELSATRGLVGGAAILSLTNGYTVPTTSSTTEWGNFYQTPSSVITAGTGIDWSSNTLNGVYTAGDGLTLNTEDFDCDTASGSVFGCLLSTDWTVFNSKVSSSSIDSLSEIETLTGSINIIQSTEIDTSAELAALLTDETGTAGSLVFSSSSPLFEGIRSNGSSTITELTSVLSTSTNATSTNLGVSSGINLFGGGLKTTANALCIQLTGHADLCDGGDATGAGGSSNWLFDGSRLTPSSTPNIGIVTTASSTIGGGTGVSGLTISGNATTSLNLLVQGSATSTNFFAALGTFTNSVISTLLTAANVTVTTLLTTLNATVTGLLDVGGGVLEVPNGTGITVDSVGETGIDTSGNQLIVAGADNTAYVIGSASTTIWSVTVASTSPAFISGGLLAVPMRYDGYTITDIACKVDSGTSKVIAIEDASANATEDITCSTTATEDDGSITNATVTSLEEMYIDFGSTSGAVDSVTIIVQGTWTRE
jgi:hypothetical protein